nr:type I CRISPR-associated protein Cas7 [Bifidobacterium breve]
MTSLQHKIDFVLTFAVENANPNGDPLNGNRPRTTAEGLGEMSDVAEKRKIRNRLQDAGERIFVQSTDRTDDGEKISVRSLESFYQDPKQGRPEGPRSSILQSLRTVD